MSLIDSIGIVLAMPITFMSGGLRQMPPPQTVAIPANAYVAEDGTTLYVAEDGTTSYVQE
jgi:hypothetical protein